MKYSSFLIVWTLCWSSLLAQEESVTFLSHIKPIIDKHCISCHSEGAIGPMPLLTYEDVSSYASMIQFVTETRYMPPWKADPNYSHFKNENILENEEIEKIKNWIKDGLQEGEKKELLTNNHPKNIDKKEVQEIVISMAESFEQYGIYYDQFQVFVVPTHFEEDVFVKAIEFNPGNPDIVKSCTISLDTSNKSDSLDNWDPRYGYFHFGGIGFIPDEYVWYHWSPNKVQKTHSDKYYKVLPKNSKLLFHINYGPTGVPQKDSSFIRLSLYDEIEGKRPLKSVVLIDEKIITNPPFIIEAGEKKRFHANRILEEDVELHSIMPQSQLICNSWEIYAISGKTKKPIKLLKIPEWDFHWKREYEFEEPIILPKGSEIHAIASFDNTEQNLYNPSIPPTTIKKGFGMFKELFLVHFTVSEITQ